jgi:hypothetical protein
MATSGSKTVLVTSWDSLKFSWSEKSQSIVNNTTTITWKMELIATSSGRIDSNVGKPWTVTINGTTYTGTSNISISNNTTKTLAAGTVTIAHNSDGTKTFDFSFSQVFRIDFDGWIATVSGSGSGTLDAIPRKSTLTASNGTLGTALTLTVNRQSSSFTHTITYKCGAATGTIATKSSSTSISWTPPMTLANQKINGTSVSITFTITTYLDSTDMGSNTKSISCAIPSGVKPTCTFTLEDTTGWDDTYGQPVQGLSKIKVKVNAATVYGSPIASYDVSIDGSRYMKAEFTTGALKESGDSPIVAVVTDARGRTGSASYTMKVLAYAPPKVSKLTVHRCDEDGTENDQGEFIRVTFSAAITALNNKNTATYTLRYKKTTASSFTAVELTDLAGVYSLSNHEHVFAADGSGSYEVEIEAKDRHGKASRGTSASTAFTLMNWGPDGTSIGLLKVAERENAVDVGGDIYLNGNAIYGAHGMHDTRDDNETPEWYMATYGKGTVWEFKQLNKIGFTNPAATYGPMQTIIPWQDSSGGLPRQVIYENRTRWTRVASSATTWGAWQSDALLAYPVGSVYIAYNHTDPATLFGGTWERLENTLLWATTPGGVIGWVSAQAAKATSGGYAFTQVSIWRRTA